MIFTDLSTYFDNVLIGNVCWTTLSVRVGRFQCTFCFKTFEITNTYENIQEVRYQKQIAFLILQMQSIKNDFLWQQ